MLISVIVFLLVYVAITFELVNKAVAAFSGVSILVLLNIISPHIPNLSEKHSSSHSDIPYAIMLIDYETIMLLFGMMIIVSVLKLIDHIIMENGETSIDKIHDFSIH